MRRIKMKKIMFATGNPSKAKRFSKGLNKDDIEVLSLNAVSYTHLRAHETDQYIVCRLLLEKKKKF